MNLLFALLSAYLLGSIPFGLIITRLAGLGDVRNIGSGNIGATNVLRTGHKALAALTLLLDMAKGYAAVLLAEYAANDAVLLAPLAVVIGHCYPVWLKFKGGKGVAVFLGSMLGFFWPIGIAYLAVWLIVFAMSRLSSLSALVSLWAVPIMFTGYAHWFHPNEDNLAGSLIIWVTVIIPNLLITCRHKDNIRRLLFGTEPQFYKR